MSNIIKDVHCKPRQPVPSQPIRWSMAAMLCHCHHCCVYRPTSNTASHDDHDKKQFNMCSYEGGALFGDPLCHWIRARLSSILLTINYYKLDQKCVIFSYVDFI